MTETRGTTGPDVNECAQTGPESQIDPILDVTSNAANPHRAGEGPALGFVAGTRIATPDGDRPVETLATGDHVMTSTGGVATLRDVRRRPVTRDHEVTAIETGPIRIVAHAFADGHPARDLWIAPGNRLRIEFLGEMSVPLTALLNRTSIACDEAEHDHYYDLGLDIAAAVLADGLAVEAGSAPGERAAAYDSGPVIEALQLRLAARLDGLGWMLDESPFAGLHLLVDGERLDMRTAGLAASAMIPVSARDVWLVSRATTPSTVLGTADERLLGVRISALSIDDGLSPRRVIAIDDPRLDVGFQGSEGAFRWTTGRARLPASLWEGCEERAFVRVDLAGPALPCWVRPEESVAST